MSTFPGAFVPVAPPADGLRLAFVGARRRRNTKAGASGAAGLLAALMVLAATGGAGDRVLMQEPLPPARDGGGVVGIISDTEPSPAASPAPVSAVAAPPVTRAQRVAAPIPGGAPVVDPEPVAPSTSGRSGRVQATSTSPVTGPMSRDYSANYYNGDLICPARKQQEGSPFCVNIEALSSSDTTDITADICNVSASVRQLSYATARELDISVRQAGEDVWRWSAGRSFADDPHDLELRVGECLTWRTTWRQVDANGAPVPAGSYAVVAEFDAEQLPKADRRASYTATVNRP